MPRILALALATLVACASSHAAQSTEKDSTAKPGKVTGIVSLDGKPAPGIRVQLVGDRGGPPDQTAIVGVSDAEGRYTIGGVRSGAYTVVVSDRSYVIEGATENWRGNGKAVSVGDGETVEGIDLTIVPGGVITGRVTASDGAPVVDEQVQLIRVKPDGGREGVDGLFLRSSMTDDRGVYRLFGLLPGRYIVALGHSEGEPTPRGSKFSRTYYPSVTDIGRAEAVEVSAGGVAKGIDVTLSRSVKSYAIVGTARYADGDAPVVGAFVEMGPVVDGKLRSQGGYGQITDASGEFRLSGLTAGTYRIRLTQRANQTHYSEPIDVDVTDHDVTGVDVRFLKGGTISGVAELDELDRAAVRSGLDGVQLHADRRPDPGHEDDFDFNAESRTTLRGDGAFTLQGLKPGTYSLYGSFTMGGDPGAFYVWSVEVAGAPAKQIEVSDGQEVSDARVRLRYGTGSVKGTIKPVGAVPADTRFYVEIRKAGTQEDFNAGSADERGQFFVEKVPSGTFDLVVTAWARSPSGGTRCVSRPTPVTVSQGATTAVEVTIDMEKDKEESR